MSPEMTAFETITSGASAREADQGRRFVRDTQALPGPWRPQMSVAPQGSELTPIAKPLGDGTLVKALARAWRWQKLLDDSVYASLSEIGNSENISKSYKSLVLRLARLAPDIIEAIVTGRADRSLMLAKLERPLPSGRKEQRTALNR
jgi:hypothetical protein